MKTKRIEKPVRNNPGIYKLYKVEDGKEIDTGKFRAMRRVLVDGKSVKEQAVYSNIEDAKAYRAGKEVAPRPRDVHRIDVTSTEGRYTFGQLVKDWREFQFLKLEQSTKQTYDKLLPHLDSISRCEVEKLTPEVIDRLVKYWLSDYPKCPRRKGFEAELDLLKTVLGYYRRRKNPAFVTPVFEDHYLAARVDRAAKKGVRSLSQEDLGRFLEALRTGRTPQYFPLALTQFCLGLRIGEAAGLAWDAIDLKNRVVRIHQIVDWDQYTWVPTIKPTTKNGQERVLVIPIVLCEELERMKRDRDPDVPLVFHKQGEPINRKTVGVAYNKALKRLGITHVSGTHMLRKTTATQANRVTGDFYAVSKMLDHSDPSITLKYVEEVTDQKRKVADALDSVASAALGIGPKAPNPPATFRDSGGPVPQCPTGVKNHFLHIVKSTG